MPNTILALETTLNKAKPLGYLLISWQWVDGQRHLESRNFNGGSVAMWELEVMS